MGKQILSQEGFEVVTASDGDEAMAYLGENRPDVVLADTRMPGPSGFEICEYVKSTEALKGVGVVLLAGPLEPFDPEHAERVRSDAVLHKPLDAYTLIETVKTLIGPSAGGPPTEATTQKDEAGAEVATEDAIVETTIASIETDQDSALDAVEPDGAPSDEPVVTAQAEETLSVPAETLAAAPVALTASPDDPLADLVDIALGGATGSGPNRQQVQQAIREVLEEALPALVETIADRVFEQAEEK